MPDPTETSTSATRAPMWIAGEAVHGDEPLTVHHPYDDALVGTTSHASPAQVERAVAHAAELAAEAAALPLHVRADALLRIGTAIGDRADEIARLICAENGKPMRWARGEVARAVSVFRWAAEEARRWSGEVLRLDADASAEGRMAYVRRVPKGPVLGIAPFNFPLNLAAHKVAPAIAVGTPVVLKPAPKTPLSGLLLGELAADTDLPPGMVQVLNVPDERAPDLVADERLPVVSFTGSGPVGHAILDAVPRKHVTLELGGNAAVLVCADWSSEADLDQAAERIAGFATYQAGQSCISVQRVYADATLYGDLRDRVVAAMEALATGDPRDEDTFVGPMVTVEAAERVEQWVDEAVDAGARLLTGGKREGATYAPTVLTDVPATAKVVCEEVFGPVVVLEPVPDTAAGLAAVNDSVYGLQAGVLTHDLQTAFRAHRELEVGGVVIGDVPSFRADPMPYGGTKASGVGREGLRYAMADYTEERVLVLTGLDL